MNQPMLAYTRASMSSTRQRRTGCGFRGFTLIELLVVVSVIALLISILLPSLRSARRQARLVKCLSNMRGLGQAGLVFADTHKGRFQLAAANPGPSDPSRRRYEYDDKGEILAWPVAMAVASGMKDYNKNYAWGVRANDWAEAKSRESFMSDEFPMTVCPSDRVRISTPFYPRDNALQPLPPELKLPDGNSYWGFLSYGINEDVVGAEDGNGPNPNAPDCWRNGNRGQISPKAGVRLEGNLERVFDPGSCLLLVDAGPDDESEAQTNPDGFANLIISAQANGPKLSDFQLKWRKRMPKKRHAKGRLNVLFTDFHGETVIPTDFYSNEVLHGIPRKYNTQVRVSPYRPWVVPE